MTNIINRVSSSEGDYSPGIRDHLQLWGLFLATIAVVYLLPHFWNYVFVGVLFILFGRSKQDAFWLVYFLILYTAPLGFFAEGSQDAVYRLPLFRFGAGLSFSTLNIFFMIGVVKAVMKNTKVSSYFVRHFEVLFFYLVFLVGVAFIVHKASLDTVMDGLKHAFGLAFIFLLYKLLDTREEKYRFVFLLLPFGFLILLDAAYFLISGGDYIYNYFNPESPRRIIRLGISSLQGLNIRFEVMGFYLSYLVFMFSLVFFFIGRKKNYFLLAALSAFIVILAGALRSWFVIYSLALIFFVYYSSRKIKHVIAIGLFFLILILPIIQTPTGNAALVGAFQRTSSIFTYGEESSSATQQVEAKISRRLPVQLRYIRENPLTGWAFTKRSGDADVGNFGLIVDAGLVGFLIFLWFWISYVNILARHISAFKSKQAKNALRMLIVLFFGILLSHFTTNMIFLFYGGIFVGCLVFISEFILTEASIYDKLAAEE